MKLNKINSDNRGEIYLLLGNLKKFPEVSIFITKKDYARGGCIHQKHKEYSCVIEGIVEYHIGKKRKILIEGETISIPKNTPHYLLSLRDSIVLEWGADPSEKKTKHLEFRKIVEKINAKNK